MKLGLRPPTFDDRDLRFAAYLKRALPPHPTGAFGHLKEMSKVIWQVLANDRFGCCAWSGSAHETMLLAKLGGRDVSFTDGNVLSDYASTGFNPRTGENDNGTDMRQQMKYRQKTGIIDATGKRHLIGAYTWLEAGNFDEALQAMWMMDFVAIGFRVPAYAMAQFRAGHKWDIDPHGDPTLIGGHYVPGFARNSAGDIVVVTWGREHAMTQAFYEQYCDQACAIIGMENLVNNKTPEGFSLEDLQKDLRDL